MSMLRLIPIAAAALLGGCVTGYTYHSGGGGDYYSGDARVEYRYIGPGYIGYGYSPYPYGYWGGYGGYYGGYYGYGGYGGYGPGWYDPWYGYYYRGPYKPRHPGHRPPPPYTPPPVVTPGDDGGGSVYVPPGPSGPPRDDNGFERPGRRYGNPPPIERPVVRMRAPTGLPPTRLGGPTEVTQPTQVRPPPSYTRTPPSPPTYVRTSPPPPSVRPPPPTYRPPAPVSVPRSTTPSTGFGDGASERARTRSGAVDTP